MNTEPSALKGPITCFTSNSSGSRRRRGNPNARFEVLAEEAHQPFQEVPDEFNTRVDAFWREIEARA